MGRLDTNLPPQSSDQIPFQAPPQVYPNHHDNSLSPPPPAPAPAPASDTYVADNDQNNNHPETTARSFVPQSFPESMPPPESYPPQNPSTYPPQQPAAAYPPQPMPIQFPPHNSNYAPQPQPMNNVGQQGYQTPMEMGPSNGIPVATIITACLPCITFGQIAEIVENGQTSCAMGGLLYGAIAFIGMPCIMSCSYRTKIRSSYGLMESPGPDWVIHFFCECCALCQEYRELKARGLDFEIGAIYCIEVCAGALYPNKVSHKFVQSRDVTFNEDSLYVAKAATNSSNLTKPNQKDQVVLEDSPENLANKSIVTEHGLSSKITQSPSGSSYASEGSKNSKSFKDSGRSDEEDSEDKASSKEEGSETPQLQRSTRDSKAPVRYSPSANYLLLTENGKLESYSEALSSKEFVHRKKDINEEMVSLEKNQTWSLVRLSAGNKTLQRKDTKSSIHLVKNLKFCNWEKLVRILISEGSLSLLKILETKSLVEMFIRIPCIESLLAMRLVGATCSVCSAVQKGRPPNLEEKRVNQSRDLDISSGISFANIVHCVKNTESLKPED
nr:protein plant cadmium resistance 4-like [Tanacetum cinerariifolium]